MKLIESLRTEHRLIEQVASSLLTFLERLGRDDVDRGDGGRFLSFFSEYAGAFHHAREEDVLFRALVEHADLPGDRGPVWVLGADHRSMEEMLGDLGRLMSREVLTTEEIAVLAATGERYVHTLLHHVDAEESVLFPESEARLRRAGVAELPDRAPVGAESAALAEAEELVRRYPPGPEAAIVRGEGCVMCPAYGDSCRGLEWEWWNEWEWAEFRGGDR